MKGEIKYKKNVNNREEMPELICKITLILWESPRIQQMSQNFHNILIFTCNKSQFNILLLYFFFFFFLITETSTILKLLLQLVVKLFSFYSSPVVKMLCCHQNEWSTRPTPIFSNILSNSHHCWARERADKDMDNHGNYTFVDWFGSVFFYDLLKVDKNKTVP